MKRNGLFVKFIFIMVLTLDVLLKQVVDCFAVNQCYPDIGCFPLTEDFINPRHRPWNVSPWPRRLIGTKFELFNRRHPEGFLLEPWNRANLVVSKFNPNQETKIIVPGWLDNIRRVAWLRQMKDAFLRLWKPCNIIVLHWRNFTPYTIATANTRVVGAELANLMKFIEHELAYNRSYYHLIGHSLGAHISGYAGNRLPGLGRITALDPARPFFERMPKSVRLDRGDACFVDAIHSDFTPENALFLLMSFGMTTPVGHLDFYPNGPSLLQPGCLRDALSSLNRGLNRGLQFNSLSTALLEFVRYLSACDHQRSHEYFIESILNKDCAFVGVRCDSFEGLLNGRCTCDDSKSACSIMGVHANQMYLNNVHEELWPAYPNKFPSTKSRIKRLTSRTPGILDKHAGGLIGGEFPLEELETISEQELLYKHLQLGAKFKRLSERRQNEDDLGLTSFVFGPSEPENQVESFYEQNSRWFLKTNNRPNYCVNQYQVLIFLGPLRNSRGMDNFRADFVITILGTKGHISSRRFRPQRGQLRSHTMQPFFVIIEGAHSLGEILSIAIAWETRSADFDPIQATFSFQSKVLEKVQTAIPTYKLKHPFLSETIKYDYTPAFRYNYKLNNANIRRILHFEDSQTVELETDSPANETKIILNRVGILAGRKIRKMEGNEKIKLMLHNIPIHRARDLENSIVIQKVIVSPLEAQYGRNWPKKASRTFCPAMRESRLEERKTLRLRQSLLGNCHRFKAW